ncbi:MAG: cupredoxin domain-containing protein [Candidatus Woesearchaeota archaeon]
MITLILLSGCAPIADEPTITNFEECIAAGNPAMESYPRQCRDPNTDRTFTEDIEELPKVNESTIVGPPGEVIIEPEETTVKEIQVTAKRFEFIPNPIVIKKGDQVKLKITSIDVKHGISLKTPFVNVNKDILPGQETVIEFTATETGTWNYRCSVYCGSGHGSMGGTLIVE